MKTRWSISGTGKTQVDEDDQQQLFKPHFDELFASEANAEGSVSDSLFPSDRPFLCGPLPITKSNILAWIMRGRHNGRYENQTKDSFDDRSRRTLRTDGWTDFADDSSEAQENREMTLAYQARRKEMRELAAKKLSGGATIDRDGRLVPTLANGVAGNGNDAERINEEDNHLDENDDDDEQVIEDLMHARANGENNHNAPIPHAAAAPVLPLVLGVGGGIQEEEEEARRATELEERDASDAIARAVRRYIDNGVSAQELELIPVPSRVNGRHNLTFRRICFAVFAVVIAFVCIMLQTLPLLESDKPSNPVFDKLLYQLLHVRNFASHISRCNGLSRDDRRRGYLWGKGNGVDCSDGVLHIPSVDVLRRAYNMSNRRPRDNMEVCSPYSNGVNASWFIPCVIDAKRDVSLKHPCFLKRELPKTNLKYDVTSRLQCFRGVHDGIITASEVNEALLLGAHLVALGGDHVQIHRDVSPLLQQIPSILYKLENLLRFQYSVPPIRPVAFRVNVALPMDSASKHHYTPKELLLLGAINTTVHLEWEKHVRAVNERSDIALPPPFGRRPYRDPCILMPDLKANEDFSFHTSVFLSSGAGEDFSGGVTLYVDDHRSNANSRKRVRRGIIIDGSRGRIVVSTGGEENMRCRLPTRTGMRAVLQIWWNCIDQS